MRLFIQRALRRTLAERALDAALDAALGAIDDTGHDWDDDPAAWVRRQRADDRLPVGDRRAT